MSNNRTHPDEARKEEQARRDAEKHDQDAKRQIRAFMATPEGRQFALELIFDTCGVLRLSFVQKDSQAGAFNEGARNVGLQLLAQIDQHAPDLLLLARREQLDRVQPLDTSAKQTQERTNG